MLPISVVPECCQNLMCFAPTVTSLSILKGLLFTTKILSLCPLAGQQVQQQVQCPAPTGWLTSYTMCSVVQTGGAHLALASRSPFLQSQMTME